MTAGDGVPGPATAAEAVAVAVGVAGRLGLPVEEPHVLAEGYSVRVHLAPAPVVVRVPTLAATSRPPIRPWLERELAVTSWLADAGAPVVPPTPLVDPGPHDAGGTVVSLWQLVVVEPEPPPAAAFGGAVRDLHDALRGYPGELPLLVGPATDIAYGLERTAVQGLLAADDLALLHRAAACLRPALADPEGDLQPLHGDCHTGNLVRTRDGRLLWNDWEDVCQGPREWDLASMTVPPEAVAAYGSGLDRERLDTYRDVRRLQVVAGTVGLGLAFVGRDELVADLLDELRRRY